MVGSYSEAKRAAKYILSTQIVKIVTMRCCGGIAPFVPLYPQCCPFGISLPAMWAFFVGFRLSM